MEEIFAFEMKNNGSDEEDSGSGECAAAPFRDPNESMGKRERRGEEIKLSFWRRFWVQFLSSETQKTH